MAFAVGRMMHPPTDVYALISGAYEYAALYDQSTLQTWLRTWDAEITLDYSSGPNLIHESLKADNLSWLWSENDYILRPDVTTEEWSQKCTCWLWRRKRGPEARKGKTDSPLAPPEEMQPYQYHDFIQGRPVSNLYCQNCKIINLCYFKTLNL